VKLCHPDAKQDVWMGAYGSAPVEVGPAAYQLSDGEIVTL
jgi:hypothetical protein